MRIYATVLCVLLLLGAASAGYCQWWYMGTMNAFTTARWAGMGATGIAAADDAAAIDFNPANLPNMELDGVDMGRPLHWGATGTYGTGFRKDVSLKVGVVGDGGRWGAGLGYERPSGSGWHDNIWGLGFGARLSNPAWTWGVSATRDQWDSWSYTWINAGVVCAIPQPGADPIRAGLLVTNILEDDGDPRMYNLGVAVPLDDRALLAVDYWDATDEDWWPHWNFGAEVEVDPDWCVRAGLLDEDLTLGVGFNAATFDVDVAYVTQDGHEDQWLVSGSMPF
jgi:hypothetical protein